MVVRLAGTDATGALTGATRRWVEDLLRSVDFSGLLPKARQVDTGADLNAFVGAAYEGDWSMGTADRAGTVSNKPPAAVQGTVRVIGGTGYQWFFEYVSGQVGKIWLRNVTATAGPAWSPWAQLWPLPSGGSSGVPKVRAAGLSADLNTFVGDAYEGDWSMGSADRAAGITNKPPGAVQGTLTVYGGTGHHDFREYPSGWVWTRRVTAASSNTWGPWERLKTSIRQVDNNADLNTFVGSAFEGEWSMGSAARAGTVSNKPPGALQGTLWSLGGVGYQWFFEYVSGQVGKIWVRNATASGGAGWTAWAQLFPAAGGGATPTPATGQIDAGQAAQSHATRIDFVRRRQSGGVGTAGKAAVALRFDDNPRKFLDVCYPLLRKYQLPGYIASAVRYFGETGAGFPEVQTAALNDGVEVANHSWTHGDASGYDAILNNTIGAADHLEQQMPQLRVDTWTMPSLQGTKMDGYDDGRYIPNFAETTAGHMITARHAVVNGYSGGRTQPLIGAPTVGQTHLTIETMTLAEVQGYVGEAQRMGTGLTLMLHPSRLDTAGCMTSAVFESVLAWLDAERQAGRLLCLSAQGIAFADVGRSHRVNMVPNSDFSQGVSGWQNNTGWSFDPAAGTATTSTGAPVYQNIVFSPFISMRGAIVELVYRARGAAGDVVRAAVTAAPTSGTQDTTLTGSGWQEIRKLVTIPANFSTSGLLRVDIGRVSGGAVTIRDVRLMSV